MIWARWCVPVVFAVVACQPDSPLPSEAPVAAAVVADGFTVAQGFAAREIADGIHTPQGAVMLGDGVVLVVRSRAGDILRITPPGRQSVFATIPLAEPPDLDLVDLHFTGRQRMLTSVLRHGRIMEVSMGGQVTQVAAIPQAASWMALDANGAIHVLSAPNRVYRLDATGPTLLVTAPLNQPGGAAPRIRGLTFDRQGRLVLVFAGSVFSRVLRFDLAVAPVLPVDVMTGDILAQIPGRLEDLVFWPAAGGDLFVSSPMRIHRVAEDGNVSVFAEGLRGGQFNALAVTARGDLLVSDFASETEPTGRVIVVSATR